MERVALSGGFAEYRAVSWQACTGSFLLYLRICWCFGSVAGKVFPIKKFSEVDATLLSNTARETDVTNPCST